MQAYSPCMCTIWIHGSGEMSIRLAWGTSIRLDPVCSCTGTYTRCGS